MKSTLRLGLALVIGLALVGSALAQSNMPDKAPEKPTGKKSALPLITRSFTAR